MEFIQSICFGIRSSPHLRDPAIAAALLFFAVA